MWKKFSPFIYLFFIFWEEGRKWSHSFLEWEVLTDGWTVCYSSKRMRDMFFWRKKRGQSFVPLLSEDFVPSIGKKRKWKKNNNFFPFLWGRRASSPPFGRCKEFRSTLPEKQNPFLSLRKMRKTVSSWTKKEWSSFFEEKENAGFLIFSLNKKNLRPLYKNSHPLLNLNWTISINLVSLLFRVPIYCKRHDASYFTTTRNLSIRVG